MRYATHTIVSVALVVSLALVHGQVNLTRCVVRGTSSQCQFNASQLHLATDSVLQFLDNKGKLIQCSKITTRNGWYGGQCDNNARDANFIQRPNRHGIVQIFGSIRIGTDVCRIRPNATGTEEMTCTPETEFPPEGDGLVPPADDAAYNHTRGRHLPVGFDPTHRGATDAHGRRLYDDSGANIDVLVVWTQEAECKTSGLPAGCVLTATTESNMRGLIDLAVEETNTAYSLSGMLSALRLVYAYRDSTYIEPSTFNTILTSLRSKTDGKLDEVHTLRTLYGADMVQIIVAGTEFCGLAYVNSGLANAFAVISSKCAAGYYSFGHEIGHHFEMKHDRATEGSCTAAGYNFGYRAPTAAFRSILAYNCKVSQCDNMPKDNCTRVQRFSNIQFLYNGQPIGNANNNNALQFNNLRATVAAHFPAMNCQSNDQCNDNNANTVDTCNVAKAICVFTPLSPPTPAPIPGVPTFTRGPYCGLFGYGLFCPFTLCGILGRLLGYCVS